MQSNRSWKKFILSPVTLGPVMILISYTLAVWTPHHSFLSEQPATGINWKLLGSFDPKRNEEISDTLKKLFDKEVEMAGYVVPLSGARRISELLLVPNHLACIHLPPPPANLMVYVQLQEEIDPVEITGPVWISGIFSLNSEETAYGTAVYQIRGAGLKPYKF